MAGFADIIGGDGTPATMIAAAERRWRDAETLEADGRRGGALYLLGYVGETCLTAACHELAGCGRHEVAPLRSEPARTFDRKAMEADARTNGLMSGDPHHIAGWAAYLVYLRKRARRGMTREEATRTLDESAALYSHWRPRLRYKPTEPTLAQFREARAAAAWIFERRNTFRGS